MIVLIEERAKIMYVGKTKTFWKIFFSLFFLVNVLYVWLDDNFWGFFLVFFLQCYYEVRRKLFEGFFVFFFP